MSNTFILCTYIIINTLHIINRYIYYFLDSWQLQTFFEFVFNGLFQFSVIMFINVRSPSFSFFFLWGNAYHFSQNQETRKPRKQKTDRKTETNRKQKQTVNRNKKKNRKPRRKERKKFFFLGIKMDR